MCRFVIFDTDINELSLPKTCQIVFPDPDDLLTFKLTICPDEVSCSMFILSVFLNRISVYHAMLEKSTSPHTIYLLYVKNCINF